MCAIQSMEYILGSTTLVVNNCDNISALRQTSIHPEEATSRWKQAYLISRLSRVYHSIDSDMLLVHVYGNHNSGKLASTLTPLASLNVRFDALSEHIMASLLIYPEIRNTLAVGLSYPYRLPSASITGVPVHSNLAQIIAYEISKLQLLQY